jgi:hypothetical protein
MIEPQTGRADFGDLRANVEYLRQGEHFSISLLPEGRNNRPGIQQDVSSLLGRVGQPGEPVAITFSLSARLQHDNHRALLGWLRAAYLAAFAKPGYRYAFHVHVQVVFEQLQNVDQPDLRVFSMTDATADPAGRAFVFLEEPWHCLAARQPFSLHDSRLRRRSVPPGPAVGRCRRA